MTDDTVTGPEDFTASKLKEMRSRWHSLSMVCWCRGETLCSACREQDAIKAEVERSGYNLFTGERR